MWRWLSYTLCVVCLVLAIATTTLWVRSYWVIDGLTYGIGEEWGVSSDRGVIICFHEYEAGIPVLSYLIRGWEHHSVALARLTELGFERAQPRSFEWTPWCLCFPHWTLVLTFGLMGCTGPVVRWQRTTLRRKHGLCETCGYDLRASPVRCPECGTPRRSPGGGVGAADGAQVCSSAGEAPAATLRDGRDLET